VREDPDNVVVLLVELADAAPDDGALAYLGAGAVEDLLRDCESDVVFDRVEGWARGNENFRTALRCAWCDNHVPADVAKRLRSLGPALLARNCRSARDMTLGIGHDALMLRARNCGKRDGVQHHVPRQPSRSLR
jgi:hypothetical protein